jgi:hypothetical protein
MYESLSNVNVNLPRHSLPKELEIIINDTTCCPTHMLAVYSDSTLPIEKPRQITMYPTHHLILASHCANLPDLFSCYSSPKPSSSTQIPVTIPVVPLSLPSPHTFPLLHAYLYTKDSANLITSLLSSSFDPDSLNRQVALVLGVWSNARALEVVDEKLFDALDEAWDSVSAKLPAEPEVSS